MPRKKKKSNPPPSKAFHNELKEALNHFRDPVWLGEHSPLASSYFLGEYLLEEKIDPSNASKRGGILRKLLREAVQELEQKDTKNPLGALLRLSFMIPEQLITKEIAKRLYISPRNFFRVKDEAIQQLSITLLKRLKPALRLEAPKHQPQLIGRDELLGTCLSALQEGKSIGLSGAGGVGKTALGLHIAANINQQPITLTRSGQVFWYTFRLGVNDHPSNLLFTLGYFLMRQGASSLWAQLITDQKLDMNIALASLRYDLEHLKSQELVLCFDEVDLLRPTELQAHANLLQLLKVLKSLIPLLLIGQQLPLEVDVQHELRGLTLEFIQKMLSGAKIVLSAEEMEQLNSYTQGNPRLLELFITLHRSGEEMSQLLAELESTPSVEFLLRRIWQRLSEEEKDMLAYLLPFRRPVSADAFNEAGEQEALYELIKRRLVQRQGEGEVVLLSAFRTVLYKLLSAEMRRTIHLRAAKIRTKRAEYTAAAYHYLQAGETQVAFRLWHAHQEQEINQGQAQAALNLFEGMTQEQLTEDEQKEFALLQAHLLKINGDFERSRQSLLTINWESSAIAVQAKFLEGDLAELKSQSQEALKAYRAGLETVERLLSEKAKFHTRLGWIPAFHQTGSLDDGWHQAIMANYEVENLKGLLKERMGNLTEAQTYYEKALALAEEINYEYGLANTNNNMGLLLSKQDKFEIAEEYLEKALQIFKVRGEIHKVAGIKINQAFLSSGLRQYQAAVEFTKEAISIFEKLRKERALDIARLNLAEAYLGMRDLDNAEACALELTQRNQATAHHAWWVLGEVYLGKGQPEKAENSLQRVLRYLEEHEDPILKGYAWRTLGKLYRAQGNQEAAQEAFKRAIEVFIGLNQQNEVQETKALQDAPPSIH